MRATGVAERSGNHGYMRATVQMLIDMVRTLRQHAMGHHSSHRQHMMK